MVKYILFIVIKFANDLSDKNTLQSHIIYVRHTMNIFY